MRGFFPLFFHSQALSVAIRLEQGCQQMQEAPSRVQAFKPAKLEGMDLRTHSRSWLNLFYFDGVVGGGISFLKCSRNEGRGYGFLKQFLQEERCLVLQVNL